MADATRVTKYKAGGSGDNVIKDGYIKTVEKVWIDTYNPGAASVIATDTTINIAKVPSGKKITSVEVFGLGGIAPTSTTLTIGLKDSDESGTTNHTLFLAATAVGENKNLRANAGIPKATTANKGKTEADVYVRFGTAAVTATNATITTIVKYT